MLSRAYDVLDLVYQEVQWRFYAWRVVQLQLAFDQDPAVQRATNKFITALYEQMEELADQQCDAAQPQLTHYELVRVTP